MEGKLNQMNTHVSMFPMSPMSWAQSHGTSDNRTAKINANDTIEITATSINMCITNAGMVPSFVVARSYIEGGGGGSLAKIVETTCDRKIGLIYITIFVNLGLFPHFETVTNIRT